MVISSRIYSSVTPIIISMPKTQVVIHQPFHSMVITVLTRQRCMAEIRNIGFLPSIN